MDLPVVGSWVVTAAGLALWVAAMFAAREKALLRARMNDAGTVLVVGGILLRIFLQGGPANPVEWFLVVAGSVFGGVSMWRLLQSRSAGS